MEDFITFELAKKLKEKGFDKPCSMYYHIHDDIADCIGSLESTVDGGYDFFNSKNKYRCSAPTISQVLKWLREEKKIYIAIDFFLFNGNTEILWAFTVRDIQDDSTYYIFEDCRRNTFNEAALAGIEYVLDNLI